MTAKDYTMNSTARGSSCRWIALSFALLLAATAVPAVGAAEKAPIPSYLKGYEALYAKDPREAAIQWFKDARFGLFVHYALASVLEHGKPELLELGGDDEVGELLGMRPEMWPATNVPEAARKKARELKHGLVARFDASNFDAGRICDLAVAAEMRYITFTTKHLGGLYMYRTKVTKSTSLNSPARRDLVAELAEACRERGLGLFLYVPPETARTDATYLEHNRTLLRELLTEYGPIAGIWLDGIGPYYRTPENYANLSETYARIRSLQPQCLISFKDGALGEEDFRSPEHFLFPTPVQWSSELRQKRWEEKLRRWKRNQPPERLKLFETLPAEINTTMQECHNRDGVGEPGGWINDEQARHLGAGEVMDLLEKARSLKANLLLNIGPRGDGSVHPADVKALTEVGRRIRNNGFPGEAGR